MQQTNRWIITAACGVVVGTTAALAADKRVSSSGQNTRPLYGAADFVPSPERPVGFGGDGSFWYAGANPPSEFQDGTPKHVTVPDVHGKPKGFGDVESTGRRNVRWKAPVPGWGHSEPIVVGQKNGPARIINVYHPAWVVCYDDETGKEVWRDELPVLMLPTLGKDRRTLSPVPDPEKAKKYQRLWETGNALKYLYCNGDTRTDGISKEKALEQPELKAKLTDIWTRSIARLMEWRKQIQADFPGDAELLAALDESILNFHQDAQPLAVGLPAELVGKTPRPRRENRSNWNAFWGGVTAAIKRGGFEPAADVHGFWGSQMGTAGACPVSDGEIVFVSFASGQMAAYEVATGKRLWAWRDPTMGANCADHFRSPVMYQDRILVRAYGGGNCVEGFACLDKRTGTVLWESDIKCSGCNHGAVLSPKIALLDDGKGGVLPVVLHVYAKDRAYVAISRISDGKTVGKVAAVEGGDTRPVYDIHVRGNLVYHSRGGEIYRLDVVSRDEVRATPLSPHSKGSGHYCPSVMTDRFWFLTAGSAFDVITGKIVPLYDQYAVPPCGPAFSMGGNLMISGNADYQSCGPRDRKDQRLVQNLPVGDMTDPRYPSPLGDRNYLDSSEPPQDILMERYCQGYDRRRNMVENGGLAWYFGLRSAGVTAHGDSWYIQSMSYLWRIAPDVKGLPSDDAKVLAAIRGATTADAVAKHLDGESAAYRYEAVRTLAKIGPGANADKLKKLAVEDWYHEIRAAAISALDAKDPQKAGLRLLLEQMAKHPPISAHVGGGRNELDMRRIKLTLRGLGEPYRDLLMAEYAKTTDPKLKRTILLYGSHLHWGHEPYVAASLASGDLGLILAFIADPRAKAAAMKAMWANTNGDAAAGMMGVSLASLPRKDQVELLLGATKLRWRTWQFNPHGLQALQTLGADAASAIPQLEKLAAEEKVKADAALAKFIVEMKTKPGADAKGMEWRLNELKRKVKAVDENYSKCIAALKKAQETGK